MTGNVIVECPRVGLVRAAMRDISLGGMFIETGNDALSVHAPVAVVFDISSGGRRDDYCLQAMIVRRTPGGVGVMFLEPDTTVIRAIRERLYSQTGPVEREFDVALNRRQAN